MGNSFKTISIEITSRSIMKKRLSLIFYAFIYFIFRFRENFISFLVHYNYILLYYNIKYFAYLYGF